MINLGIFPYKILYHFMFIDLQINGSLISTLNKLEFSQGDNEV